MSRRGYFRAMTHHSIPDRLEAAARGWTNGRRNGWAGREDARA